jgi:hypothetical protein
MLEGVTVIGNPVSYAANVRTAEAARDLAIQSAPTPALAQVATTIAAIKSPQAKKEALESLLSQATDDATKGYLTDFIKPLTKFGKKAK